MRKLSFILLILLFIIAIKFSNSFFMDNLVEEEEQTNEESLFVQAKVQGEDVSNRSKQNESTSFKLLSVDGLHTLIGEKTDFVIGKYGQPMRIDLTPYDYEWWIYPDAFQKGYLQIGVENNEVVTVYVIGEDLPTAPFHIDASYNEIQNIAKFKNEVPVSIQNNSYKFTLTEEEIKTRPLIFAGNIFIQLYFDQYTSKLSSIRYLNGETLIKHRPYSVVYRGKLIEPQTLSSSEWREVETGSAMQIFEITNVIRKKHNLNGFLWDDETAKVAYLHSEDMKKNDYFSHTSPSQGELKDRLEKQGVVYQLAGENIAAKYVDSIEAVTGWLNSEGHRVNLLHEDFTHLGVGVYERYYTQNFMTPW